MRFFGKTIPLWFVLVVVAIVGIVVAASVIGTVKMPWKVEAPPTPTPRVTMTPSSATLEIGRVYFGVTKTVEPTKVAVLTVSHEPADLTFTLDGDYSGFDEISITVQLVQNGEVKYEAVIEPTIVVSDVMYPSPTGVGGWSDKEASQKGCAEKCFVRVLAGEGDLQQLIVWKPGASIDTDGDGEPDVSYPNTPFGYVYDEGIPETGCIFQNDNDGGEAIQLVVVYPPTSATIEDVAPGTYDVYVGFTVTAGHVESSGMAILGISYSYD